jgi:hypothetical protein
MCRFDNSNVRQYVSSTTWFLTILISLNWSSTSNRSTKLTKIKVSFLDFEYLGMFLSADRSGSCGDMTGPGSIPFLHTMHRIGPSVDSNLILVSERCGEPWQDHFGCAQVSNKFSTQVWKFHTYVCIFIHGYVFSHLVVLFHTRVRNFLPRYEVSYRGMSFHSWVCCFLSEYVPSFIPGYICSFKQIPIREINI